MKLISERFPADKGIAGRALREGKTQVVNDVQSDPDFFRSFDEEHAFKTKQGLNSCKDCRRPLKSWTPCARQLELL
jgi:hypothetical protein